MVQDTGDENLLRNRWRKSILREAWVEDGETVVKRFVIPRKTWRYARPWEREHRALMKLKGVVPGGSLGFEKRWKNGDLEVILRKTFVPGSPLTRLCGVSIPRFAELLARMHCHGVVMYDPNLQNFVQDKTGAIHCIDFGRAATFAFRSPFFYYSIGSEFAKCIHEAFDDDEDRWTEFLVAYYAAHAPGGIARWVIHRSFLFARKAREARNMRREV